MCINCKNTKKNYIFVAEIDEYISLTIKNMSL